MWEFDVTPSSNRLGPSMMTHAAFGSGTRVSRTASPFLICTQNHETLDIQDRVVDREFHYGVAHSTLLFPFFEGIVGDPAEGTYTALRSVEHYGARIY
jgi:hypothetical protein